jgi:hypothetical protein
MRYLKLFENFETEKKFSVSFETRFYPDVVSGLKNYNIRFEEKENLYLNLKKQTEIIAWSENGFNIIRAIPAWVKHLQVYREK